MNPRTPRAELQTRTMRARKRARVRARARARSAGAALFVVAVTLGLLAAMGVYGLTTAAQDVRAAGHIRLATQTQHMAESGVILTAQTMTPGTGGEIVRLMHAPPGAGGSVGRATATDCKTAKPWTGDIRFETAEACKVLEWDEMRRIANANSPWFAGQEPAMLNSPVAADRSFGEVRVGTITPATGGVWPAVRVELTNPDYWEARLGTSQNVPFTYAEIRATVLVDMKVNGGTLANSVTTESLSVAAGRGRIVVGPYVR
jgi:hypothetical protein